MAIDEATPPVRKYDRSEGTQPARDEDMNVAQGSARRDAGAFALDPIAAALKRLHEDVVSEPIPDDFLRLLANIDDKRDERPS